MEDNQLKNVWNIIDSDIKHKSKADLDQLLNAKTRKTLKKFLFVTCLSILVCIGLIIFLMITALNRKADIPYMINNMVLCLITIIALITSLVSWYKLQQEKYNQSLKNWLEERILLLSKRVTGTRGKIYLFIIPVIYILMLLSIHVYFENKLLFEVIKTEDSMISLSVATSLGLIISYFAASKIRKYHLKNLDILKGFHDHLFNEV